jgi:hypothetical protein
MENANYSYAKEHSGFLLNSLLDQNILTQEELARSRFDVRVCLLRAGQSQNPLGIHCDFFNPEASRLKILFVTNAYSETRLYTQPCVTTLANVKDWYRVVRQPEIEAAIRTTSSIGPNNYVVAKCGEPVMFTDRTLHEAKALTKDQLPAGSEIVWRYMIRIVVYPSDRLDEVPKSGGVGVSQVYMLTEQEM